MYNELATVIGKSLEAAYGMSTEVTLGVPENASHGDLTTNVALQLSKKVGKAPREVGETVVQALEGVAGVENAEVVGPGFVNITLTTEVRLEQIMNARKACSPKKAAKGDAPVIIEYSQPNIAKPLGVHHILSTVLGQAVSNLYRHLGYNVISWNYIGDWGTQFGKLAVAMEKWGDTSRQTTDYALSELLDLYVRFHEEVEKDASLDDEARAAFKKLEEGDKAIRSFWSDVVEVSKRDIEKIYERLHVSFDLTRGESPYEDLMKNILAEGKEKNVFVEGKEGALIVEFPEGSNLPVYMVMKADGATLYSTRDLAQMKYRIEEYHPQEILIFTDIAQQLYFQQLEATCKKLGWELPEFENVLFGRMSFTDRSMSTRKGNIIRLEEALDEAVKRADTLIAERESEVRGKEREELAEMVGIGAFVYAVLSQSRKSNMVFTWDKALTFEGNSGPYIQYTHARARSVLRKGEVKKAEQPKTVPLLDPHEVDLMKLLSQFPDVLEAARAEAMPHKLTNYLYELCQSFNSFYSALPILTEEQEDQRALRIALTEFSADVIKVGAEILTLRVPDRM